MDAHLCSRRKKKIRLHKICPHRIGSFIEGGLISRSLRSSTLIDLAVITRIYYRSRKRGPRAMIAVGLCFVYVEKLKIMPMISLSFSLFHLKQGCTVGIKKMKIITVIAISWFDICYCMEGKRAKFHQQSNRRHLIFSFACRTPQDLLTETFNLSEWIFTACVSILKLKDL